MLHLTPAFRFGFTASLLVWATLNSLSYFFRSGGWGNLLGGHPDGVEAIGFPWTVWREGAAGSFLSYAAMAGDAAVVIATSLAVGLACARLGAGSLNALGPEDAPPSPQAARQLQFSLRSMLLGTAAVAFVLSAVRANVEALAILLLIVYLFGPGVMLSVAHLSRRIVPLQRSVLLGATGLVLLAAAAVLGEVIEGIGDFTRGIMGIFVCWVPQCLLILVVVVTWQKRARRSQRPPAADSR